MSDRSWVFGDRPKRRAPPPTPPPSRPPEGVPDEGKVVVEYAPIRCPVCGGKAKMAKARQGATRYHYCQTEDCGLRFMSVERPPRILFCPSKTRPLLRRDDRR